MSRMDDFGSRLEQLDSLFKNHWMSEMACDHGDQRDQSFCRVRLAFWLANKRW